MKPSLNYSVYLHQKLKEELLVAFPELADDEQALADTLEGESDLTDKLTEIIISAIEDDADAEKNKALAKRYQDRAGCCTARSQKKRDIVLLVMGDASIKKIPSPYCTISRCAGTPGVQVIDEALIPKEFLRIKSSPDLKAIKEALKEAGSVPGCTLKNASETLSVRK